jgi:hypothetical protein
LLTAFFGVLEGDDFFAGAIFFEGTENTGVYAGMKQGCYFGRLELKKQSGRG